MNVQEGLFCWEWKQVMLEIKRRSVLRKSGWLLFLAALLITAALSVRSINAAPHEETPDSISSLSDLEKARFCVVLGSVFDVLVRERFPEASVNQVSDWAEECIQVEQGKADAILWEASSLNELNEEYPALYAIPEVVSELEFCWTTPKTPEGEKLCREVNAFIEKMKEEDQLEEIYHRWENPETAPDHVDEFPMTGTPKGELKVVSCLDWQPVCYLNGSNACGYMIELLYRFCAFAGYTPVPEYVDVQSALAGMNTGRYDMMAYGMVWQEEASEAVYFTDGLMSDDIYAVISKDRWAGDGYPESAEESSSKNKPETFIGQMGHGIEKTFIREDRWKMLLDGFAVTVGLSVFSILFGTVLGALVCFLRMRKVKISSAISGFYIRWMQGMPIILTLLILYYVIFGKATVSAFWVCVLGFTLDFSAYSSEIFRSGIMAVSPGQVKAAKALGFSDLSAFRYIVLPQMIIHCLPVYMGQVISTVKLTSVAGYISVLDLTRVSDLIRARTYEAFFPLIFTALVYFIVAYLLTLMLKKLEKKLDPVRRKRKITGVRTNADQD